MTDRIRLTGLRGRGYHGVLAEEKRRGQDFVADVSLLVDTRAAALSDDLADTVDYSAVAELVVGAITGPSQDLIETVAAQIADRVLQLPLIEGVEVTLHKPSAPIGVPFSDVAVVVRRERDVPAVIGLGSNQGHRRHTLAAALRELDAMEQTRVIAVSDLVETDPVGGVEQPDYLNAVALVRTRRSPRSLLRDLAGIEARYGRDRAREVRWGPRTLDLDLLQFGVPGEESEERCDSAELTLPHPRALERAFVLVPWSGIAPAALVRGATGLTTVSEAAQAVDSSGVRPGPSWPAAVPGR